MTAMTMTDVLANPHHSPTVGATLFAAGLVPNWFDSAHLSAIYYLCLIPPALWYLGSWFFKEVVPGVQRLFKLKRFMTKKDID